MRRYTATDPASGEDHRGAPYESIQQSIITGEIPPGAPLVELALAATYDTSRTPIREALIRLEQDGLVVRGPHGLRVREISPEQILDFYDTRITLEAKVAAVAAERRTEHDLVRIRVAAVRAHDAHPSDGQALAATNWMFHEAIARASHNETLIDLLGRMNMQFGNHPMTTLTYPGRHEVADHQHHALVEAIERRDGEEAARIAAEHFTDARKISLIIFADA